MEKIQKKCICWKQCMIGMDGERQRVKELHAQKLAQKPCDKPKDSLFTSTPWRAPQKTLENYERDRVEKYPQYFNGNTILPILELNKEFKPLTVSFVVSDNKIRRLAGLRREAFEEVHQAARVPCK